MNASIHDPISKILQFDNDGDKGVVSADPLLIEIAERNVKRLNVRPLYYEMDKAEPAEINSDSIFTSLKYAYKANIISVIVKLKNFRYRILDTRIDSFC